MQGKQNNIKALIVDNIILYKDEKNNYFAPSIYNDAFFSRYLKVFSRIKVVAKVFPLKDSTNNYIKLSCHNMEIVELPPYRGIKQMFTKINEIRKTIKYIDEDCDCSIFRAVQLENLLVLLFGHIHKPYAVEVVNDPKTFGGVFSCVRIVSVSTMKYLMNNAIGVSYITKHVLQEKYPCVAMIRGDDVHFYDNYPTIDLQDTQILKPRHFPEKISHMNLLHVSNQISGPMKGHITVIKAAQIVIQAGYDVDIYFLGDGDSVKDFINLSSTLGIKDRIHFVGRIADSEKVKEYMVKADLFVFPSYSEGQGRVNIEAQATGLPCIASKVGGIVELFDEKYLFDPEDYHAFANEIMRLFDNPKELEKMSADNIENAKTFSHTIVSKKRTGFYEKLKKYCK